MNAWFLGHPGPRPAWNHRQMAMVVSLGLLTLVACVGRTSVVVPTSPVDPVALGDFVVGDESTGDVDGADAVAPGDSATGGDSIPDTDSGDDATPGDSATGGDSIPDTDGGDDATPGDSATGDDAGPGLTANADYIVVGSDNTVTGFDLIANDVDPEGRALSLVSVESASHGTVVIDGARTISYTPEPFFYGRDGFTYTVTTDGSVIATGEVQVDVMTEFTWTGQGTTDGWDNGANWCGGVVTNACQGAATGPTAAHTAVFDGTCTQCNARIVSTVSINRIELNSEFFGSLTQEGDAAITIGSGGFVQHHGAFVGGTGTITLDGNFELHGGSFLSTRGVFSIGYSLCVNCSNSGGFTQTAGTFLHNDGTVQFDGEIAYDGSFDRRVATVNVTDPVVFFNLVIQPGDRYVGSTCVSELNREGVLYITDGDTIEVENLLTHSNGNIHGGTIDLKGNLAVTCADGMYVCARGGNAVLRMSGTAPQEVSFVADPCDGGPISLLVESGATVRLVTDVVLNGIANTHHDVTVNDGTLDLNGHALNGVGTLTIGATGQVLENGGDITYTTCVPSAPAVCPPN